MNPIPRSLAIVFLALALGASAQPQVPPVLEPLRVKNHPLPVFPYEMLQVGERSGKVLVAFSVDQAGRMDDCLPLAYSHPAFARVTVATLRRWTFEPARYEGRPIASVAQIQLNFEVDGTTVVSLTPGEQLEALLYPLTKGASAYHWRELRELDRIPTPIVAASPPYPRSLAAARMRSVTVSFYIDERGRVRLPCAGENADPVLAGLAINALSKWRFEPPTCGGVPVLASASQVFRFKAKPGP